MRLAIAIAAASGISFLLNAGFGAAASERSSVVDSFPGQLNFLGNDADNVGSVDIDFETSEYLVVDQTGLTAGENCRSTSRTTARCSRFDPEQGIDRFVAPLNRGDDRFKILMTSRGGRVLGEQGDDRITGSAANSVLAGDLGRDLLRGLGGSDVLVGGPGHDRLYGGPDDDRIHADNDDRDRMIACGPGHDTALIDGDLDPKPKNCERIRRRR